jgi:bifunctional non-homologous end joining protein LigD
VTYEDTKPFAKAVAETLERSYPDRVVARMAKDARSGRVLVDWSQNTAHKSTVAAYSLRAKERPTVSAPLTWEEVAGGAMRPAGFTMRTIFDRLAEAGDLFEGVLEPQDLDPALEKMGVPKSRQDISEGRLRKRIPAG